ncbi:glycosyltransferase family 4 protein [Cylindrospermum sp. FACHB-282]|uniref:glycosyltransferase family 4 protein n=1 Tax=Cylindrospermum sp. FACHB-282 TaxID=2692794 RepID=UPI001683E875|nr:glycosyltransferase family 1 protein [Cylindrospermum sp. FACHB-282]MBD2388194.1 glycosyltransferase family 4 protein [Cylindrospermum sp. FACHB-282]
MQLQDINVLVDGYNLEMTEGTGIKTYGVTLIKALTSLGVNVDILCSRNSNSNSNSLILNEALFFDRQNNHSTILKAKMIFFAAIQKFYQAQEIPVTDFVIKQDADYIFDYLANSGKIFNLDDCYRIANNIYKLFQIKTKINIKKKLDIWHATYPVPIKVNNAKKITTIHDLIPLKLPHTTLDDKKFFFNLVKNSIKDSALILTISENTKKDILHCFDIDPDKIHLTYQPIIDNNLLIKDDLVPIFLRKYKLKLKKYILFVGSIEPKKNVGRLIDAYSRLDTEMQLVLVGKKGWLWEGEIGKLEAIFGKGFTRRVKLLEYVTRQDLSYLYKGAFCFVFPSLYEGFGLPPLEAMSMGCPVITSNIASLPEVCGDAAIYIDPYNSEEIRQAIEKLINNPQMQTQLIEAGKKRVEFFSMENYTKKLYEAYTQII